jgi:ABC-type dipeptide/oligopeptide/nickel transport system permease subunit
MSVSVVLKGIWANDNVRRVVHTFWQAFIAVFLTGIMGIISGYFQTKNISVAEMALLSLTIAAFAAGLSAIKGIVVGYLGA